MWRRKAAYFVVIVLAIVTAIILFRLPMIKETPSELDRVVSSESTDEEMTNRLDIASIDPAGPAANSDTAVEISSEVCLTGNATEIQPSQTAANNSEIGTVSGKVGSSELPKQDSSKQDAKPQYRTIHHEAEYKIIHHDAVTIHHDAEYKVVHHEEEGHYEDAVITPAWDEEARKEKTEQHVFCSEDSCHMDFTAAGMTSSQIWDHLEAHAIKGEASGHHTEDIKTVVTETIRHEAQTQRVWITDKDAWDEKVLIKEAWEEIIPAYDERVLVKEAWDEIVPE